MADIKGDPSKQPANCKPVFTPYTEEEKKNPSNFGDGKWSKCPNLKEVGGDFDTERWGCKVCGEYYTLYYDDMK